MKRLVFATLFTLLAAPPAALAQDDAGSEDEAQPEVPPAPEPDAPPADPAAPPAEPAAPTPAPAPAAPAPAPVADASATVAEKPGEKKGSNKFFSGGLKIGAGVSTVSGDEIEGVSLDDYGFRIGPSGGGFLTFRVHHNVAVQWEAYFNYKGASVGEGTFRLNYLDMPLLAKGIMPLGGPITPNVHVGPYISHVQISKVELDEMDREINFKEDPQQVETFDLGVVAGVGANYQLPVGELTGDLRFQQGFRNVIDLDSCAGCAEGDSIKNRSILLQVGYVFP
jgi:hypothetical protein